MEGVEEDIPGVVLDEGLPWTWETFPDYMNVLDQSRYDMNVAAEIPHAPSRVYVMGQRGVDREPATEADVKRMAQLAHEAIGVGTLGFSTSRSMRNCRALRAGLRRQGPPYCRSFQILPILKRNLV